MRLDWRDHRKDPAAWASELGIPRDAVDVYLACEPIDLHTDSFLWTRLLPGYDLAKRHRPFLWRSAFVNQVDLPRAREAQMAGVCWDIPTNPWRRRRSRPHVTRRNIERVVATLARFPDDFAVVSTHSEYVAARAAGKTASFVSLQGGQGVDDSIEALESLPDVVHRITLVHLTESRIGAPNSQPRKRDTGLSAFGREFVRAMQRKRILVDLAHINRKGFFDALEAADRTIPPVVTHTGVNGVRQIWRNIDDDQIRAVAERGGTIGIIFHPHFLAPGATCPISALVDHVEHVVKVGGEDAASLGSDYDGMIMLPDGLRDVTHQPKIVADMLARGWKQERIAKVLGGNFLRVLRAVRP